MARPAAARLRNALVVVAGLVLAIVAGCARPPTPGVSTPGFGDNAGGASDSLGAAPTGMDCDSDGVIQSDTGPVLGPLPTDSVLISVTRCLFEMQPVSGDGEWLFRIEQKAESGLDGLASALRLPSQTANPNQSCLAIGYVPIILTVTDDKGRQLHPLVPQTACGAPQQAAIDAIIALPWTTVGTTKTRQVRSELEVSSGCSGSFKPVIPLVAAEGSGTQTSTVDTSAGPLRVCRYELDPDPANVISLSNGTPYRGGRLVSASTLDAAASKELLTAIAAAPRVTGSCAQAEYPFAVLQPASGGGPWITIERGGCNRMLLDAENYLRQLDADMVTRLIG
jgi:hypothetical protein